MPTSPSPLSQVLMNAVRPKSGPLAAQSGPGVLMQAGLLKQGVTNPLQLSALMYEMATSLQGQINTILNLMSLPPTLQNLVINSADIGVLTVGGQYGPGQLTVLGGPPSYPTVGFIGTNPSSPAPVINITNVVAGLFTTGAAHGLAANQVILIAGASDAALNGYWVVATTPLTTTLTVTGYSGASTGGTLQRQFAGGHLKSLAVGGANWYDAITNALFADENGNLTLASATIRGMLTAASLNISQLLVSGLTLTDNSPGAGSVAWNTPTVYYQGAPYSIAGGNTSSKYITWTVGAGVFVGADSFTPGPTIFLIATNTGGVSDLAWNKLATSGVQRSNLGFGVLVGQAIQPIVTVANIFDNNPNQLIVDITANPNSLGGTGGVLLGVSVIGGGANGPNGSLKFTIDGQVAQSIIVCPAGAAPFGNTVLSLCNHNIGTGTVITDSVLFSDYIYFASHLKIEFLWDNAGAPNGKFVNVNVRYALSTS